MNERTEKIRKRVLAKEYNKFIDAEKSEKITGFLSDKLHGGGISDCERMIFTFEYLLKNETPVILPDEKIVFIRTIKKFPSIYSDEEMALIKENHYIHEAGYVCNICPDYAALIEHGLENRLEQIENIAARSDDTMKIKYAGYLKRAINAIIDLTDRYAAEADRLGMATTAEILKKVPRKGAETFREALQCFRILHFSLWLSGSYHNTVGRFDQFMYKYYKHDIGCGAITESEALELLEEFFITFNKDSDFYPGVQQGDNGQSLILGGYINENEDGFNELSALCLKASLNLKMIDPKINLRVNKLTSPEIYNFAVQLTKQGLGFPQYSNDDVVIPGLVRLGYDYNDAVDYTVAACWEFIIPGIAMDIPNIGALSFVKAVNKSVNEKLSAAKDFNEFFSYVKAEITAQLKQEISRFKNIYIIPSPVMTLFHNARVENLTDISLGGKYNNFGIHGTGIANAADSLYSVKKHIFDDKDVTKTELLTALENNYAGSEVLKNKLKYDTEKFGDDNSETNRIASELMEIFTDELKKYTNERGGIFRGGTGSAMYYIWHSRDEGASADGRKKGEFLSANFSPSLDIGSKNPLAVVKSFTSYDMTKIINGGPLTLELHDSVFKTNDGIYKTAALIKEYIRRGGHQLQINAVNREKLLAAKENPGEYKNLIVRVWGWSGYFIELEEEYQNQIIKRAEYDLN